MSCDRGRASELIGQLSDQIRKGITLKCFNICHKTAAEFRRYKIIGDLFYNWQIRI